MAGVDESMLSQDHTWFCTPGVEAPLDRPVWDSGIDILAEMDLVLDQFRC